MLDEKYKNSKPPYIQDCTENWALSQDSVPDYPDPIDVVVSRSPRG